MIRIVRRVYSTYTNPPSWLSGLESAIEKNDAHRFHIDLDKVYVPDHYRWLIDLHHEVKRVAENETTRIVSTNYYFDPIEFISKSNIPFHPYTSMIAFIIWWPSGMVIIAYHLYFHILYRRTLLLKDKSINMIQWDIVSQLAYSLCKIDSSQPFVTEKDI